MPYIDESRRKVLGLESLSQSAGDLAYIVYREALGALGIPPGSHNSRAPRFEDYARVMGAIEAAKIELYRRLIAPYEDSKRCENGDI